MTRQVLGSLCALVLGVLVGACSAATPFGDGGAGSDQGRRDFAIPSGVDLLEPANADLAGTVPTCTASNCQGCCKNGLCLAGDSDSACGTGGAQCDTCDGTTNRCQAGSCDEICGPATCAGCCAEDPGTGKIVCMGGGAVDQCGKNGANCIDCGVGAVCSSGVCVTQSCASQCAGCCDPAGNCKGGDTVDGCGKNGATCAVCQPSASFTCNASRECEPLANAKWDVWVSRAEIPANDVNNPGKGWDDSAGSLPDSFVKVTTSNGSGGDLTNTSATIDNTLTPNWSETLLTSVTTTQLQTKLVWWVYDYDTWSPNDLVGTCSTTVKNWMFGGSLIISTCGATATQSGYKLWWKLVPH